MQYYLLKKGDTCENFTGTILDIDEPEHRKLTRKIYSYYAEQPENSSTKEDILHDITLAAIEMGYDTELVYNPLKNIRVSEEILTVFSEKHRNKCRFPTKVDIDEDMMSGLLSSLNSDSSSKSTSEEKILEFRNKLDLIRKRILELTEGKQRKILSAYFKLRLMSPEEKITYRQLIALCKKRYGFTTSRAQIIMAFSRMAERLEKTGFIKELEERKKMDVVILPEIKKALVPLRQEELAELEKSLLKEGCREPLIVWSKGGKLILVDGHNRYGICKKHNIPFNLERKDFNDLDDVLEWIYRNQLGRRNLTKDQFILFLGKLYQTRKKPVGRPVENKLAQNEPVSKNEKPYRDKEKKWGQNDPIFSASTDDKKQTLRTAEKMAREFGVGSKTVKRAAKAANLLETKAVPELQEAVKNGKVKLNDAAKTAEAYSKDIQNEALSKVLLGEEKRVSTAARKIEEARKLKTLSRTSNRWSVRKASFLHYKPDQKFDVVITELVTRKEDLSLYEKLAKKAKEWLKPDGIFALMCEQFFINDITAAISRHLKFHWLGSLLTQKRPVLAGRSKITTSWKPVLLFAGEKFNQYIPGDLFKSEEDLVASICKPGCYVFDPLCGSGSRGVFTVKNGCFFWGIDPDSENIKKAKISIAESERQRVTSREPADSDEFWEKNQKITLK